MLQRKHFAIAMRPLARRHFGHSAEQALRRPRAQEYGTILAPDDKRGPAPELAYFLGGLVGKTLRLAARLAYWQFHYSHQRGSVFRHMVTGARRRTYSRVAVATFR